MSRWLVSLAFLPVCTGCLYYAYPTLTHTPELAVDNKDGSVHAFRVEVDRTERRAQTPITQYTLMSIPLDSRGLVPAQLEVAPATGVYDPLGVIDGPQHERNQFTMLVRLYKPGYKTVEVKAWEKTRDVQWVIAADLLAQEKAIDDVLAVPPSPDQRGSATWWELRDEKTPVKPVDGPGATIERVSVLGLQPGVVSIHQKKALEFASREYQRLASSPAAAAPSVQIVRERLQQKATWLRRYAEQAPTP